MKLLIYGAGVIGSLYAALFREAGYDTTVYARGQRFTSLKKDGLLYEKNGKIFKAKIRAIDRLEAKELYDFIFLTVKENQVHAALDELRSNHSPNIVTMVNTLERYDRWEEICGANRIIPAFPGGGGSIEDNILKASLTPRIIQPTTFAEINGEKTERIKTLAAIFRKSKIPCQIVKDMQPWQICHLAMVVPIADAYYQAKNPETVWSENNVMTGTAKQLKRNFDKLWSRGIAITPGKLHIFRILPTCLLSFALRIVFKSRFGILFMYQHSMKAADEMNRLHDQLYNFLNN